MVLFKTAWEIDPTPWIELELELELLLEASSLLEVDSTFRFFVVGWADWVVLFAWVLTKGGVIGADRKGKPSRDILLQPSLNTLSYEREHKFSPVDYLSYC